MEPKRVVITGMGIISSVGNDIETTSPDDRGRIDNFVWRNVSKDLDMIDMVMYANHIFNPFAIKEEEILTIPVENDNLYVSSGEPTLPDGTRHSDNTNGAKTRSYAETVEYLAKKGLGWK